MESQLFRYVQVACSYLDNNEIVVLIRTTNSEDKRNGLDSLILRHNMQIHQSRQKVIMSGVVFMSSEGEMSGESLPIEEVK